MDKITRINMIFSIVLQIVTIISGFIIPRQILLAFGSEVNGLVNSITKFLNYISLIEGGLGSVIMTALYQPLNQKKFEQVSSIIVTSNNFFRKIAKIFIGYLLLVAVFYPLIVKTNFSYGFIFSLTMILGIGLFIQYYFAITWKLLLQADRRVYVASGIQILVIVLNTIFTLGMIRVASNSIHLVKLVATLAFVIQPLLYDEYVSKFYVIDKDADLNVNILKNRWDGFGINLAAFLNSNIDVIILTILSTLSNVSIYGVYYLVVSGIKSLIVSISAGITPSLGKDYSMKRWKSLEIQFSKYENLILYVTFCMYSCAIVLIVPFVSNYTRGIYDANYIQPIFSILLILSYMVFCIREPYVNMAYVGNAYRKISKYAYIEALINLVCSLLFVYKYGLNGVALGTFFSMTFRTIVQILYLQKNILFRDSKIVIVKIFIHVVMSLIGIISAVYFVRIKGDNSWKMWVCEAICVSIIIFYINAVGAWLIFNVEKKYINKDT